MLDTGDSTGNQVITLSRGGTEEGRQENVQLAASDSKSLVFEWFTEAGDEGDWTVTAESENDSAQIAVTVE